MKKLTLSFATSLCMLLASAQVINPADSFFNYYCNYYKHLMDDNRGMTYEEAFDRTSVKVYRDQNNPALLAARNYIKRQNNFKSDKDAMMRLIEINSGRFLHTKFIDLTNKDVIKKYDEIYKLLNSLVCNCVTAKKKGKSEQEFANIESKVMADCLQQTRTSQDALNIRKKYASLSKAEVNEMGFYFYLYMYTHCSALIENWITKEKNGIASLYANNLRKEGYNIIGIVEKYIQRTDTITTIEKYFENAAAYKSTVPQLNAWRKALQVKYITGHVYYYRYDLNNNTDFYRLYTKHTSDGTNIAMMIKYVFKEDKIASITYIDGDNVPQKEQVLHDFYADKRYDEDTKNGSALGDKKN